MLHVFIVIRAIQDGAKSFNAAVYPFCLYNVKGILRDSYLILKKCFHRLSSLLKMHYHWCMESNPDIAPLFVRRNFLAVYRGWR